MQDDENQNATKITGEAIANPTAKDFELACQ